MKLTEVIRRDNQKRVDRKGLTDGTIPLLKHNGLA
jgi:hypothetical protein